MGSSNQPNWLWIMLLLFFGSSILGGISFSIVTILGLPFEWSAAITLGMIGTIIVLIIQRYSLLAYALAACVGAIIMCGLAIFRGVAVKEPTIPPDLAAYIEDSSITSPFDMYGDYGGLENFDYVVSAGEERALLLDYPLGTERIPLTIEFPTVETAGGQWAFESGFVQASGALSGRFTATPDQNWTSTAESIFEAEAAPAEVSPYMVVSVPISAVHQDKEIRLRAEMKIAIPTETGEPETQTLTREVGVLVASLDFYTYQADYDTWQRARRVVETPLWLALVAVMIGCGVASVILVRQGALEKTAASDFVMIVRKPSGLKQLGVEAHNIAKLEHVETQQDKGVMLGFVNAQSPAGRGGLRAGDVVVDFDNKAVTTPRDLNRLASKIKKGESVPVKVQRDGQNLSLNIRF